jgi:two-component system sensor histidine kinase AtoS
MMEHLEQKEEFERRMQNLDKLVTVGQLAAGIAHEIKNPLTSIRSLVELLKDDASRDAENSKVISVILSEVDRLNKVTNEFVSLSRPRSHGKYSFFDMNIVIRNTIMLMGPQLKKNGISVFTNMNAKIHIYGDHDEMAQVFLNLILNSMQALEAKKENRSIIINTSDASDHSYIEIIDNGCGIPPENVPKVFMPFFTDKKTGTGLGLSIVKRILDDMKAQIAIESQPGAGTAFKIRVPIKSDYSKNQDLKA